MEASLPSLPPNKSYSDMKRSCAAACPPSRLESIVASVKTTNEAVDVAAATQAPTNFVKRCEEIVLEQRRKSPGRTLNEAIDVEKIESSTNEPPASKMQSLLRRPPLILPPTEPEATGGGLNYSSLGVLRNAAAKSKRRYLDLMEESKKEAALITSHERSLTYQRLTLSALETNVRTLDTSINGLDDDINASRNNCLRVISQIERLLPSLVEKHQLTAKQLEQSRTQSLNDFERLKTALSTLRDPIVNRSVYKGNLRLHGVMSQQLRGAKSRVAMQKSLLYNRLYHAGTINTHLTYPVFCLKFDKTGRYFITGADDYLVKIFCLASATQRRVNNEPIRGAILVCTLKGHAGVINDIQISSDNCFVATASEDGDVRVWGLHNGCPIAVLRGHVGGANMVSLVANLCS
jgi:WD domain, G-beta repeat